MLVGLVLFLAPLPAVFTAVPVTVFDRRWTVSLATWPNSYSGSFILPAEKPCTTSVEWTCLCSSLGSTQQRLRRGWAFLPQVCAAKGGDSATHIQPVRPLQVGVLQHLCTPEPLLTHSKEHPAWCPQHNLWTPWESNPISSRTGSTAGHIASTQERTTHSFTIFLSWHNTGIQQKMLYILSLLPF